MTEHIPVIAIDGPSGSGKGTVAERVAKALGYSLLDSGALYRLLGIAAYKQQLDLTDHKALEKLAADMEIEFGSLEPGSVVLNGEDVTVEIRTDIGSDMASKVGAIPAARNALFARQLAFRAAPGLVADGRDMGTVVFPDADVKIFLTASLEERADRRYKQLIGKGIGAILPDLLRELKDRDARDSQRAVSPLEAAADASLIDTTELTIEQVVEQILALTAVNHAAPSR